MCMEHEDQRFRKNSGRTKKPSRKECLHKHRKQPRPKNTIKSTNENSTLTMAEVLTTKKRD